MRWRRPPSSSCGYALYRREARPTVSISSATRFSTSDFFRQILFTIIGCPMVSLTVIRGFRDAYGSWKIICISVRRFCISFLPHFKMSLPSKKICPALGSDSLSMVLPSVDLPHPDSPTTPRVCPCMICMFTSSTAWSSPAGVWKYFFKDFVSSNIFLSDMPISPYTLSWCLKNIAVIIFAP